MPETPTRKLTFDLSSAIRRNPEIGVDRAVACLCGILLLDKARKTTGLVALDFDGSLRLIDNESEDSVYIEALPLWGTMELRMVLLDPRLNAKLTRVREVLTCRARGADHRAQVFRSKTETAKGLIAAHKSHLMYLFTDPCRTKDVSLRFTCAQIAKKSAESSIAEYPSRSTRASALAAEALSASIVALCDVIEPVDEVRMLARATLKMLAMQDFEAQSARHRNLLTHDPASGTVESVVDQKVASG